MPRTPLSVRVVHLSVLEPTAQGAPDRYVDIRVELGPEAVTDGLLQRLSGNALKVLVALARHLRPLVGVELDHAIQLGLATPDDAGKLTTFVTDVALANELQLYRATVQKALQEWEAEGLLTITTAPYQARTLDGRYQLGRLVMLSLAAGQAVRTGPTPLSRAEKSSTVRAEKNSTAAPSTSITPTRAEKNSTVRAEKSSTKSDDVDDDDNLEDNTIFQAFAAARQQAYHPTARDRSLLAQLRAAGYQPAEILAAIQRGVAGALAAGQRPRRFSYVVPIVREQPPGATPARLVVLPEVTPPVQPGPAEEPAAQPAVSVPQALNQTSTEPAPVLSGPVNADWATLQNFCAARGLPLTPAQLQDLLLLARDYAAAAARVEQTGLDWTLAALQAVDSSVAHPVRYVRAILKQWQAQPSPPHRPAAAPVTADDEAATGADDVEDDVENQAAPAVAPPSAELEPTLTLADGTTQPVAQLWHRTLAELELQMTRATFDTWLRDSAGVGLADATTLTVQVKNQYAVEWLENRLAPVIQRTLYRLTGQALGIQFVAAR